MFVILSDIAYFYPEIVRSFILTEVIRVKGEARTAEQHIAQVTFIFLLTYFIVYVHTTISVPLTPNPNRVSLLKQYGYSFVLFVSALLLVFNFE